MTGSLAFFLSVAARAGEVTDAWSPGAPDLGRWGLAALDQEGEVVVAATAGADGAADLLVHAETGDASFLLPGPPGPASLLAADWDGDGLDDAIVGLPSAEAGGLALVIAGADLLGGGDALETASLVVTAPEGWAAGASVATADLDGDGALDLLVGSPDGGGAVCVRGGAAGEVGALEADGAWLTEALDAGLGSAVGAVVIEGEAAVLLASCPGADRVPGTCGGAPSLVVLPDAACAGTAMVFPEADGTAIEAGLPRALLGLAGEEPVVVWAAPGARVWASALDPPVVRGSVGTTGDDGGTAILAGGALAVHSEGAVWLLDELASGGTASDLAANSWAVEGADLGARIAAIPGGDGCAELVASVPGEGSARVLAGECAAEEAPCESVFGWSCGYGGGPAAAAWLALAAVAGRRGPSTSPPGRTGSTARSTCTGTPTPSSRRRCTARTC